MVELHSGFKLLNNISGAGLYKCEGMIDPTAAQDYVTKNYTDSKDNNFLQLSGANANKNVNIGIYTYIASGANISGTISGTNLSIGTNTINTAGINIRAIISAPNSNWGNPFGFVCDSVGRGFLGYTQDWNDQLSGGRITTNVYSTYADISVAKTGGSASGDLALQGSSGNVGIGTTAPLQQLEISKTAAASIIQTRFAKAPDASEWNGVSIGEIRFESGATTPNYAYRPGIIARGDANNSSYGRIVGLEFHTTNIADIIAMKIFGNGDVSVAGNISGMTLKANNGFTGSGAYTNFTISGGIILTAS